MELHIQPLRKKDEADAIRFAITGMHFNWYLNSRFLLQLYGRYFWYLEKTRATQVIAAYAGDALAGVLLARFRGETAVGGSLWETLYIRIFEFFQNAFYKDSAGVYETVNKKMRTAYLASNKPDGEIIFLAANPEIKIKGTGSKLLAELEGREKGKTVFLHTDDACTYQFYEHRGFACAGRERILLRLGKKQVPLQCLLYSKRIEG